MEKVVQQLGAVAHHQLRAVGQPQINQVQRVEAHARVQLGHGAACVEQQQRKVWRQRLRLQALQQGGQKAQEGLAHAAILIRHARRHLLHNGQQGRWRCQTLRIAVQQRVQGMQRLSSHGRTVVPAFGQCVLA